MLRIYRAERSEDLVGGLAQLLAEPLRDPLAREVIAVPAKGVERWINQQLATVLGAQANDGIAANIDYSSPSRIVANLIATATGVDPDRDPWSADRLSWTVLEVVDSVIKEPWCAVLARHLGEGTVSHRNGRRYATAAHLAGLFSSYASQRPSMLVDWATGADDVDDDLKWQPELFRRVRSKIGPSPAERLPQACAALRSNPDLSDLPERISVFGPTRLTAEQLEVFAALGEHRDVVLWLPHPSAAMWEKLANSPEAESRSDDRTTRLLTHPLLASLGHSVRELQLRLRGVDAVSLGTGQPVGTLLEQLQDDIRHDRLPTKTKCDHTIQIHSGHGPARQAEILRECLLGAFEDDPTLEPRDVLIMCPDVETYAPLIRAAFGQAIAGSDGSSEWMEKAHPAHQLRVRLADRALNQTNDVLTALNALLALGGGRVTASQLLDFAALRAVATKFGFGDDELVRLREWTAMSGARWGLGAHQRNAFGLNGFHTNTIELGLDRVVLGIAADEGRGEWLDMALPLDVESNDISLAGRFAELVDTLADAVVDLEEVRPVSGWLVLLTDALDNLTAVDRDDEWQAVQARRELASATAGAGERNLRLADIRAMLARTFEGRPTRSNFRNGDLTVCTMVPMRSVPHRVIALLGVDDDTFPRKTIADGDDALLRNPRIGERESRIEDRQLLLDAIMACRGTLMMFFTGADPVTGKSWPPAVPVGEVLDVVHQMTGERVVKAHPLQPFDARNFTPPFSFDRSALQGAVARELPPALPSDIWATPLPALPRTDVPLKDLVDFVIHPSKAFLRQRFGIWLDEWDIEVRDDMPVELDGLQEWSIGDRMLSAALSGIANEDFKNAEWRRSTLPPKRIGMQAYNRIADAVNALSAAASKFRVAAPDLRDVDIDLGDGRKLVGTITGIHGRDLTRVSYSSVKTKHRLDAWVQLLALAVAYPGEEWQAVTIGKRKTDDGFDAQVKRLRPPENAREILLDLVRLRDDGLRRPLHIAPEASETFAVWRKRNATAEEALKRAETRFTSDFGGDQSDAVFTFLYGPKPAFDDFANAEFQQLAEFVWNPLLGVEK
ncbi:MAG: exodeoxyribonuclease V subunit gamma [Nocardiaceae bacterium]|nr:exodeoxyribonuclease V subunit gamma [Nocardiaceae bacterium]